MLEKVAKQKGDKLVSYSVKLLKSEEAAIDALRDELSRVAGWAATKSDILRAGGAGLRGAEVGANAGLARLAGHRCGCQDGEKAKRKTRRKRSADSQAWVLKKAVRLTAFLCVLLSAPGAAEWLRGGQAVGFMNEWQDDDGTFRSRERGKASAFGSTLAGACCSAGRWSSPSPSGTNRIHNAIAAFCGGRWSGFSVRQILAIYCFCALFAYCRRSLY
ncbi:hypothetical protein [Candidatus Accumulibacter sp. ACC012]|uniref:hypothetical protein n=1 Tax=Candidatus Accumulibacter sp. ACC012 TaxID=2823332 RepID=UPI0025BA2469|nr:hypothetical protein [Candidatus Accumulibacter sp. ACC012]